ncbi:GMC oxidoreductase [Paenarthrobacter aurescens]|uniref:GMC oxidoreductase n=1 Tax=Paenarthrobacter aurescens TaxID=43663 RepID=UPI0021C13F93|nr:GMC oxidoreductase [Paenarthrobacter aurescens]MCT9868304.1 GMC oxidoreductase [Paenarthrobacter aurescens]
MAVTQIANHEREYPSYADVVIVGSGPAGAAYARILSELRPEASVVLFEAGPTISDPPGAHVKNISDVQRRAAAQRKSEGPTPSLSSSSTDTMDGYAADEARLLRPGTFLLRNGWQQPGEDGLPAAAMSSNVGGMAAHWTGACPRPGASERIGFLGNLDELLSEGERLLSVTADALAEAPLADEVRRRLSDALDTQRASNRKVAPMPLAVRRTEEGTFIWSGSDVVFGETTRSNPNFALVDESLVTQILTDGGQVTGVKVRDLRAGTSHVVTARFVIVAADALRTPQLLFASAIRPSALGRYLNDQPQIVYAVQLRDVPAVPESSSVESAITAQSGVSWVPFTDEEPFHGQVMQLDASPVPIEGEHVPGSIVGLGWFCAKDIQPTDRVAFSDEDVDDYGMPAMRIHYSLTEKDKRNLQAARASIVAAGAALGEPLNEAPLTFPPGASLHYQGTVRMGERNDGTSVCDPTGRVWDVQGLYVAGNGVIPTATACNPTLTGVALAVAGARAVASLLVPATSTQSHP